MSDTKSLKTLTALMEEKNLQECIYTIHIHVQCFSLCSIANVVRMNVKLFKLNGV